MPTKAKPTEGKVGSQICAQIPACLFSCLSSQCLFCANIQLTICRSSPLVWFVCQRLGVLSSAQMIHIVQSVSQMLPSERD